MKKQPAKAILEAAGIEVESGLLKEEAEMLNEIFMKHIQHQKPFVALKVGMSLDGKIAMASGESKYITGEKSLKSVRKLRREMDAVLVGIGTILADNPSLNVRYKIGRAHV